MKIYLGSKSSKRKELLTHMEVDFDLLPIDIVEVPTLNETPINYSKRITEEKLAFAWQKILDEHLPPLPVLCADTESIVDNKILGKPENYDQAFAMLKSFSKRTHEVITTVGIRYNDYRKIVTEITKITCDDIPNAAIEYYLKTHDYKNKSGGYSIEGYLAQFIEKIDGDFYSVLGLPVNRVRKFLDEATKILS